MSIVPDFEGELELRSPRQFGHWLSIDMNNRSSASHDYRDNRATAVDESVKQIGNADVSVVMFGNVAWNAFVVFQALFKLFVGERDKFAFSPQFGVLHDSDCA